MNCTCDVATLAGVYRQATYSVAQSLGTDVWYVPV